MLLPFASRGLRPARAPLMVSSQNLGKPFHKSGPCHDFVSTGRFCLPLQVHLDMRNVGQDRSGMRRLEFANLFHCIEAACIQVDTNAFHIRWDDGCAATEHNFRADLFRDRRNF